MSAHTSLHPPAAKTQARRHVFARACVATAVMAFTALAQAQDAAGAAAKPNACHDFDEYINGAWKAATELPADRARVGSFDALAQANDRLLAQALPQLVANPAQQTTPGLTLLAAYYASGMDTAAIERQGLRPLQPLLQRLASVERPALPALLGELMRHGVAAPMALWVGIDAKDATRHVLSLQQSGLGLPDRDDYTATDARSQRLREAYRRHALVLMQAVAPQAADAEVQRRVDAVIAFEGQLAAASMDRIQRRDPNAVYNPVTPESLQALAPGWDWRALLASYTGRRLPTGIDGSDSQTPPMVLGQPDFARAVARLAAETPLDTWRDYLALRLLDAVAPHGPQKLAQSHFDFNEGAQRGLRQRPPRVEEVIRQIGGRTGNLPLGQALGELFVTRSFSPLAQQRALQMVEDIRTGMRQRVLASPWMSAQTQKVALGKLDAMTAKIGAPPVWPRYEGLQLRPDDYLGNLLKVNAWATADRLPDLDRPVDRGRWNTSPHIVNAFAASGNQIVFPAGILQPPFFDEGADDATNYGAIGMVIGHEITHHFDDRGRQFDAVGNLRDWWNAADVAAYRERADRVAALYSGFEPVPGERINGRQTLGENISDVGGMQIAFAGLQIALERQRKAGRQIPLVDGRTPEQRFFIANALVWRIKWQHDALVNQIRTGQHSPGRYRILGPMSQMTSFAEAFNCKPGERMVATDPIVVW
jgi:putative endopeptidase